MSGSLITHQCHLWLVTRRDGLTQGFTDHDGDLHHAGVTFRAATGMTASALQQSTGLSVNNSEALGVLSDAGITEADLSAGRYDGAEVQIWRADWRDAAQKWLMFRGNLGEITRSGAAFRAELRGMSERLNAPMGRVYGRNCDAVLGDKRCGFDRSQLGYITTRAVEQVDGAGRVFIFADLAGFAERWFDHGRLLVDSGDAAGLAGMIKSDRLSAEGRRIELWQSLRADLRVGDWLRLEAGCDKRLETCRLKFNNIANYQGFPFIPGEDWLTSYPRPDRPATGGSLWAGRRG